MKLRWACLFLVACGGTGGGGESLTLSEAFTEVASASCDQFFACMASYDR
jgi:hypothetical protein